MNSLPPSDLQQAIQQSLQNIALQLGQSLQDPRKGLLDSQTAEQIYLDASALLGHLSYEPLTLAHVAGTLLVYQMQNIEAEELAWFRLQVQQCASDEEVEELIESMHRADAL
jgi:hypothetical protein